MKAIIWSKDHCPYCVQAKNLLNAMNIEFQERNISVGPWTKEQLLSDVPDARTLPQIFLDDQYVGGFNQLRAHLKQKFNNT